MNLATWILSHLQLQTNKFNLNTFISLQGTQFPLSYQNINWYQFGNTKRAKKLEIFVDEIFHLNDDKKEMKFNKRRKEASEKETT